MDGAVDLMIEDDESSPRTLEIALPRVASECDVLLGPYSTQLMKRAGLMAADSDWLIWNHGGSGDDVETTHPGHVVSVLTPTGRYAEPFLQYLDSSHKPSTLQIVQGKGSFGRQVAVGAERLAAAQGINAGRFGSDNELPSVDSWDLFAVGQFEHDVETVKRAQALPNPPRRVCAVAAGVQEFGKAVENVAGIFGIAQWFPDSRRKSQLGPTEQDFLAAYSKVNNTMPDYPAIQAVAGAVLAVHSVRLGGGTARDLIWRVALDLDTETLFGGFKIDSNTGVQVKHETTLVRWTAQGLTGIE